MCFLLCESSFNWVKNPFPHDSQNSLKSPVCLLMWDSKFFWLPNLFLQCEQGKLPLLTERPSSNTRLPVGVRGDLEAVVGLASVICLAPPFEVEIWTGIRRPPTPDAAKITLLSPLPAAVTAVTACLWSSSLGLTGCWGSRGRNTRLPVGVRGDLGGMPLFFLSDSPLWPRLSSWILTGVLQNAEVA